MNTQGKFNLLLIFILWAASSFKASAQPIDYAQKPNPSKLREDFAILRAAVEEAQTSIYRYNSKKTIDSAFDAAMLRIGDSTTYTGFVALVTSVQRAIACGHSSWEHSREFKDFRRKNRLLFPFEIAIRENRYFIAKNLSKNTTIPPYTEILEINGKPVGEISKELAAYMPVDGLSSPAATREIEEFFRLAYSNFIGYPELFTLLLRDFGDSIIYPDAVHALSIPEIDSIKAARYPADPGMGTPLEFYRIDSLNAGIFKIKWFNNEYIATKGQNFVAFTDSIFAVLAESKTNKLIIDLRGNAGGWTANGKHLFSYFIKKEMPYIAYVEAKKTKNFNFSGVIVSPPGYNDTMFFEQAPCHYSRWTNNPNLRVQPTQKNQFNGTVYILTDEQTKSAASIFASMMNIHTTAVIAGEETGSSQCGTGGILTTIRLPYSRLLVTFSTAGYYLNTPANCKPTGVIPDVKVQRTAAALPSGTDEVIEKVVQMLRTLKKR